MNIVYLLPLICVFLILLCDRFVQNTVILRAIPGLNELGKALLGNVKFSEFYYLIDAV